MARKKFPTLTTRLANMTIEMAKTYLAKQRFNRPLDLAKVARFADLLKNGKWSLTHEGIAFDWDGFLIDGQHRLNAIIASGVEVQILVTEGLDPKVFSEINVGPGRSAADFVGMVYGGARGWSKQQDVLVAARLNAILLLLQNRRPGSNDRKATQNWANEFLPGLEWSMDNMSGSTAEQQAMVAGTFAYLHMVEPKVVESILPALKSGAGLEASDPVLTLRNRILQKGRSVVGAERRPLGVLAVSAVYAKMNNLRLRESDKLAEQAMSYFREKYASLYGAKPAARGANQPA